VTGGNFLDIEIDRVAASRYGLLVDDIQNVVRSAIGGMNVTETVEGLERYPVNVRYPRELRQTLEGLNSVLVHTPMGHDVPLGELAHLKFVKGPPVIKSEGAHPTGWIYVDVSASDIGGYVKSAQAVVAKEIKVPAGYRIVWSGQFEYMQRASERLRLIVPLTLVIVFLLLYMNFRSLTESLLIMALLPLALTGGVWLLWLLHYELSVAVGVGFIALAGVSAETGVIMLIYIKQALADARTSGEPVTREGVRDAVLRGATERIRPKMMTVCAIIFGLIPIMWSSGAGASVMKRIAAPMIGGMASATLLTLFILPIAYGLILQRRAAKEQRASLDVKST
jgi:Cu(I)/Ag(I) efflux system membrane protein CusA/SilA